MMIKLSLQYKNSLSSLFSDANPFLNIFDPLFRTLTRDGIS